VAAAAEADVVGPAEEAGEDAGEAERRRAESRGVVAAGDRKRAAASHWQAELREDAEDAEESRSPGGGSGGQRSRGLAGQHSPAGQRPGGAEIGSDKAGLGAEQEGQRGADGVVIGE
jgi:hypothetical protein